MPNDLNDLEEELKDSLEQRAALGTEGEHLDPELLVAYHAGKLARAEEKDIQAHLVLCRECTALLLGLNDLIGATGSGDAGDEWEALRSRLPQPPPPGAVLLPFRRRGAPRLVSRRLVYGLAASLAAATVVLSAWVVDLRHQVAGLTQPQVNAVVRDLYLADAPRDAGGGGFNEVPAGAGLLTLILNSAETRTFPAYRLVIEDGAGAEIWRGQGVEKSSFDTFTLVLPGRFLPAGDYRIRLFGREGDGWTPIEEYPLRVL